MGLVRCYNVLFNVCHCVVSLALIGLSIYLLVANTSAFSFVFLGISCFWYVICLKNSSSVMMAGETAVAERDGDESN